MLHIIQSDPGVTAGVLAELLDEWRIGYRIVRPDLGESLPARSVAVIVLGGEMGVHDEAQHPFLVPLKAFLRQALQVGTPLLGSCLGGQLLADAAGGTVTANRCGEKGLVEIALSATGAADPLFAGIAAPLRVFHWHNDSFSIPPGAQQLASSPTCPGQAFRIGRAWGLQFHPEVDLAIVTRWSRRTPAAAHLPGEFVGYAAAHRAMARQLLGNFLGMAGIEVC